MGRVPDRVYRRGIYIIYNYFVLLIDITPLQKTSIFAGRQ